MRREYTTWLFIFVIFSAVPAAYARVYDPHKMAEATQAIRRNPRNAEAYFTRSWFRGPDKRASDLALADVNEAIKLNPHVAKYYFLKASILNTQEEDTESLENIEEALKLSPNDAEYLALKSEILYHCKKPQEALKVADIAIKLSPQSYLGHDARARALMVLRRWDESLAEIRTELKLEPTLVPAQLNHLTILRQLGKFDEVIVAATEYLARQKKPINIKQFLIIRGQAYEGAKRFDKAIEDYKSALALFPDERPIHVALAKLYHKAGKRDLERREVLILKKWDEDFTMYK